MRKTILSQFGILLERAKVKNLNPSGTSPVNERSFMNYLTKLYAAI